METLTACLDDHARTWAWLNEYLSRGQENLGRTGNVCPFMRPSLNAGALIMETAIYDEKTDGVAELCHLMQQQIDRFSAMPCPKGKESIAALVTVMVGLPEHQLVLLDEAQRRTRTYAVKQGYMLGQFHSRCAEPGVLNPAFPVSRSPEPLFAVRRMIVQDIMFLHRSPVMFAEYQKRFGDRYDRPDHPMPETHARLYALAQQRGSGRSADVDYQNIDVPLNLPQPPTDHPTEMTFYLSGQLKELLFKLMHEQACAVRVELAADRVEEAIWGLRRLTAALDMLSRLWDLLGMHAPTEFNAFRDQLDDASDIDSYIFWMVEFTLGKKSEELASRYALVPSIAADIYRAFHDSSLYDEVLCLLVRQGLLAQGTASPESWNADAVSAAWAGIYRQHAPSDKLFRLAEALMDVAEGFGRWRTRHLLTVEQMIGSKPETGGTDGIAWLRRSAEHRFFPELWAARTRDIRQAEVLSVRLNN